MTLNWKIPLIALQNNDTSELLCIKCRSIFSTTNSRKKILKATNKQLSITTFTNVLQCCFKNRRTQDFHHRNQEHLQRIKNKISKKKSFLLLQLCQNLKRLEVYYTWFQRKTDETL